MDDIVIVSAARTPVGSFNGALSTLSAHNLGAIALQAAIGRAKLEPGDVDELIYGQVLAAGEGQNPTRQAARLAGMPDAKTAFGINQVCGSGLRSVALAAQQIRTGESAIVAAGGMESMSLSAHAAHMRNGTKMGSVEFVDTMLKDGLWDAFHGDHMGTTAENVAQKYQIRREEQDAFALGSQQKASAAQKAGRFKDEITAVTIKTRKGEVQVTDDEYIRHDASVDSMAKL
ncbi:MAG: acetyl-CoA C-acetyltransferase, partial [Rhodopila sp.]